MNQPKPRHKRWWAIGLFICVSILFVIVTRHTKNAKQPAPANEIKPAELTSCDHLIEARKALIDGYKPDDDPLKTLWGRVYDARIHLEAIKHDSPEYAETQRLMDEVQRREAEREWVSAPLTQTYLKKQREAVVGKLERYFVGKEDVCTCAIRGRRRDGFTIGVYVLVASPRILCSKWHRISPRP
ncbi:MAG: hypothetical protein NG747_00545 [Candidatus Brocadia sp.]|nr:hypothetical protein [Candidatus Brocadia sp.]